MSENHSENGTKMSNKSEIAIEMIDDSGADKFSVIKSESSYKKSRVSSANKANISLKEANELESRKQFWIKEVTSLKKSKTLPLKKIIHPEARFEDQTFVMISSFRLM